MIQSQEPYVSRSVSLDPTVAVSERKAGGTLRLLSDPRLLFWNIFLVIASPVLLGLKLRRYQRKRNNHELNMERWTLRNNEIAPRSKDKKRVAFAVASFGEILLVDPLTRQLRAEHPNVEVIWVVRDSHTLEELRQGRPDQATILWPFDALPPVNKFLHRVDPDLLVFAERYSFPNLLAGSRAWGAKALLINGRVKAEKGIFRKLTRWYDRWLFGLCDQLSFQSEIYAKRALNRAPAERVHALGNLKLDLPRRTLAADQAADLDRWLGAAKDLPLIVAGSTDNLAEERFVLESFAEVLKQRPCRLLLAPRKPGRMAEVQKLLDELGLRASYRSRGEAPAEVMILDTMGELAYAYGYGIAAYVGGAYNGMGHNIVEPLEYGIPVSYGSRRGHFEELQRLCEKHGVGFRIVKDGELAQHWLRVLDDSEFREQTQEKTRALLKGQQGSMQATYDILVKAL